MVQYVVFFIYAVLWHTRVVLGSANPDPARPVHLAAHLINVLRTCRARVIFFLPPILRQSEIRSKQLKTGDDM